MFRKNFVKSFLFILLSSGFIQSTPKNIEVNIISGLRSLKYTQKDISKIKRYINKRYKKLIKNKRDIITPVILSDSLSFEFVVEKNGSILDIRSFQSTIDDTAFNNDIQKFIHTRKISSANETSVIKLSFALQYEKKKKMHGISFDILSYTMRDKTFSPLSYGGTVIGGTYFSIKTGCKSVRTSYTSFSYGSINSDISRRSFSYIHSDGQEDYYRLVLSKHNRFNIYAGGLFDTYVDFLLNDIPTWTMAYSLNISCFLNYRIDRKRNVYFKLYSPLLTYSNRPAWGLFDNEIINMSTLDFLIRGKFTSVNTYRKLSYKIRYSSAFNKKLSGIVGFDFHYLDVSEPLVLKSILTKFQFGLMF